MAKSSRSSRHVRVARNIKPLLAGLLQPSDSRAEGHDLCSIVVGEMADLSRRQACLAMPSRPSCWT